MWFHCNSCWDGKNLDTADHMAHMSYPANGTFDSRGPCPESHPVPVPQLMYEVIWDTSALNNPDDWPEDGSQPFVWSFGDEYVFLRLLYLVRIKGGYIVRDLE